MEKQYFDFLSDYTIHNSRYFQKSMDVLLVHLKEILAPFRTVWLLTDGGRHHFKTRISMYYASTIPQVHGMFFIFFTNNKVYFVKTIYLLIKKGCNCVGGMILLITAKENVMDMRL